MSINHLPLKLFKGLRSRMKLERWMVTTIIKLAVGMVWGLLRLNDVIAAFEILITIPPCWEFKLPFIIKKKTLQHTTAVKCKKAFLPKIIMGFTITFLKQQTKDTCFIKGYLWGLSRVGLGHKSKIKRRTDSRKFIDLNLFPTNENVLSMK